MEKLWETAIVTSGLITKEKYYNDNVNKNSYAVVIVLIFAIKKNNNNNEP